MIDSERRSASETLWNLVPTLAEHATESTYSQQPELGAYGPDGRARTWEDFAHHFRALAALDVAVFRAHVDYCYGLFAQRGFPARWLDAGWTCMRQTLAAVADPAAAALAIDVLAEVTGGDNP